MIYSRKQACNILGIKENDSVKMANQKYRDLVKELRPDLDDNEEIVNKFIEIKEAIDYIRENDFPIYPVEFVLTPMEKIKNKIKFFNINFSLLKEKSFQLYKKKIKEKQFSKVYSKKKFA